MNIFSKMKKAFMDFITDVRQVSIDKENRKKFISEMKIEMSKPQSKFNRYGLKMDDTFETISCIVTIPENFQLSGNDAIIKSKLNDEVKPVNIYLVKELNWGEYIEKPNFYHIELDDDDTETCDYLVTWSYKDIAFNGEKGMVYRLIECI